VTISLKIVVQKFGGTSIASSSLRELVVRHVVRAMSEGYRPVVVVSAMGRVGDPYATDTLIKLARETGGPQVGREIDMIMSCGEVISAVVMAQTLKSKGHPAVALTGGQAGVMTDEHHGQASILRIGAERLQHELEEGKVPVVAGFQGISVSGDITTLGRGASDTTAVALGVALAAELVEIYTDVDGVKTADPRIVPNATTLTHVTYSEVVEMAHLGARVIHPRAVEIAREGRLPLKVRSTSGEGLGTLITDRRLDSGVDKMTSDRPVVGIAHVPDRTQVQIDLSGSLGPVTVAGVFRALGDSDISVDMIHLTPKEIQCIISTTDADQARDVIYGIGLAAQLEPGFAKVSAVGAGMHGVPGIMGRIASALARVNIAIYQTTDSHANISCLVREEGVALAVKALHDEFGL
jgi:aspartate kinase